MNENDRDPIFYYKKGSLMRSSLEEAKSKRAGIFKNSVAARANIMVFISVIVICVMFGVTTRIMARQNIKLGENTMVLNIVNEEGILFLDIVKKAPKSGEVYMGIVNISVFPAIEQSTETPKAFSHRITFNPAATERYRVSLPFDGNDFYVTLNAGEEQKTIRVNVKE